MRSVSQCNCQTIPPSSSLSARSHLPCKAKEAFLKVICLCQNGSFKIVGTGVPDCPNRMSAGAVPGRNYKLLPALATNSPPDYSRSASRPALRNKVNLRVYQTTPTQKFFAGLFQKMRCLLFQKSKSPLRVLRAKGSFGIIG